MESRPPSDAATALLVTGPRPSQTIFIDRHLASGVQSEPFSTDPARQSMAYEAKWLGASLVLIKRGNAGRGAAPAIPDREEVWSVAADGTLHVDVNDRLGHATTTTHLVYRRVPIPATVRAGDNLLENPGADRAGADWLALRDAKVEPCDGNPCFVVRNQGSFRQTVLLPADAVGKYVVMIGAVSSERINPDMAITGLPYLYGMVAIADGSRYLAYLQGMLARPITPNSWTKTAGVFPIPVHAARVSFQLNQAERRGTPQNDRRRGSTTLVAISSRRNPRRERLRRVDGAGEVGKAQHERFEDGSNDCARNFYWAADLDRRGAGRRAGQGGSAMARTAAEVLHIHDCPDV